MRHADLAIEDEDDRAASSGLVIDDDEERNDSASGIVADDDEDEDEDEDDDDDDDDESGLVADDDDSSDDSGDDAEPHFGDPLAISAADAQRIADGKLDTAKVLGLLDRDALLQLGDAEVCAQLARFHKKLTNLEMQFGDLQKARGKLLGYRAWLDQLAHISQARDPARQLRALIQTEDRRVALDELTAYIKFVLDDRYLEWAEHKKVLRKAEQYGLTAGDVEAAYRAFEPFDRQPQVAAERAAPTGWTAHPRLVTPGELEAWNLARLHDALLQQFEVAVDLANQPFDKTYSLYDYLDRNRDVAHKEHALRGRAAAEQAQCPQLAVWYFLWHTGSKALHVGRVHRPVRTRKRQVESVAELLALVASNWIIDDLACGLEAGLLEHWLLAVTGDAELFQRVAGLRSEARGVSNQQRVSFLRQAVLRVLWQLGMRGLPLHDDARRAIVVEDLAQLTAQTEACWSYLHWALFSGALSEWLETIDPMQATRARNCAGMGDVASGWRIS